VAAIDQINVETNAKVESIDNKPTTKE